MVYEFNGRYQNYELGFLSEVNFFKYLYNKICLVITPFLIQLLIIPQSSDYRKPMKHVQFYRYEDNTVSCLKFVHLVNYSAEYVEIGFFEIPLSIG